ncbi:MAG: hypothetical protein QM642_12020 [Edaphocola sp.]
MQSKLHLPDIQAYKGLRGPAKVISYLLHPLFMPLLSAFIVMVLDKSAFAGIKAAQRSQLLINIGINTIGFPLLSILLLKALGFIESIQLKTTKERIIPLIATMTFYFWAYLVVKNLNAPLSLRVLMLGCFWGIVVVFLLNIFMKVSMHTAAAGGVLSIIVVLMFIGHINLSIPLLLALLVGGTIGTARLVLYAHTPWELWLGYIAGMAVQLAAYGYLS